MSSFPAAQPFRGTVTAAGWGPHRVRDVLLAVLAFAAGSIDVLSWLTLAKVFSAFMTGNVVFLAAGLFSHQSDLVLHAAVALWSTAFVGSTPIGATIIGPIGAASPRLATFVGAAACGAAAVAGFALLADARAATGQTPRPGRA
jgi:uncharacterized membrane protein YoaK (UPF0700 family)